MYIIRHEVAVYHQCEALYIIKPQVDARWRVMRYSPEGADDMHDCVVMIYQACGLDKKILVLKNEDFLVETDGFEPSTPCMSSMYSNHLSYASKACIL